MLKRISLVLGLSAFLAACNGGAEKKKDDNQPQDSTVTKANSPELKRINDMLQASPNNPDLYLQRGRVYLALHEYEAAAGDGSRALALDSTQDAYYLLLTDAYFYSNHTRQAKDILERCVRIIPTSTEGHLKLAELYLYVKKYQQSIDHINAALKVDETIAKAYFLKGMCYKESGDTAHAISSFQTACEQDNQYYDAYVETGRLLALKRNPLCIQYFNNALKLDPKSVEVVYMVGKFYQDNMRFKEAVEAYNKLLQMDDKNKNALYNLGAIEYVVSKDKEKAKGYFTKAIEADPQYAEAYLARGLCFEDMGDADNAIADYKMALQAKPNYEDAIRNMNRLMDKKKGK
jgi:tetratricopeptide (TPR) repeat protein